MTISTTGNSGGETSLATLLSTLSITLHPEIYVFATLPSSAFDSPSVFPIPFSDILLLFREPSTSSTAQPHSASGIETITLILRQATLTQHPDHGIEYTYPCRMLTCNVHSSLPAVGFMATLSVKLAERSISVNPVAGYFHDHLFIPVERAEEAVEVLQGVREDAAREGGRSKEKSSEDGRG